jgi:hypothetical protein
MLMHHLPNEIEANIAVTMDEAVAHSYDLPPRDVGIACFRVGGDLTARLAEYFKRANDRILMQAAGDKGGLVEIFTNDRASLAANNMSSRSPASRSGNSAIDCLGVSQDRLASDEIAARLDSFALDEIDRTSEELLQCIFQLNQNAKIVADSRLERHEEVRVAARWIEVTATCGRTEDFQASHAVTTANGSKGVTPFDYVSLGGHVRSCLKFILTTDRQEMP